jgi:competence protein ComEA
MKKLIAALMLACLCLPAWANQPVNVNTASAEEIAENLKGIGLSKAQKIIEYRDANGAFGHVDELVNVKGIGVRTVDQNRGMILIENRPAGSAD